MQTTKKKTWELNANSCQLQSSGVWRDANSPTGFHPFHKAHLLYQQEIA